MCRFYVCVFVVCANDVSVGGKLVFFIMFCRNICVYGCVCVRSVRIRK